MASPVAQMVKNLPANQETQVWSLGREDPLEKEMATHSSILAWEIPWTEEPAGLYSPWGCKRVGHDWVSETTPVHVCAHTHRKEMILTIIYLFLSQPMLIKRKKKLF